MMIRPDTLAAIRAGDVDLAFRRWDRPRVVVGTRAAHPRRPARGDLRRQVAASRITAEEARRAGAASLAELRRMLEAKADRPVWRVGLRHVGRRPARGAARDACRTPTRSSGSASGSTGSTARRPSARGRGRRSRSSTGPPPCAPPTSRRSWGATPRASSGTSASSRSSGSPSRSTSATGSRRAGLPSSTPSRARPGPTGRHHRPGRPCPASAPRPPGPCGPSGV